MTVLIPDNSSDVPLGDLGKCLFNVISPVTSSPSC